MGWLTESFYDKGNAEGEAKMLIRFLENRFGGLPDSLRERIFAANSSEIESWAHRVCHAPDLRSVFHPN